MLEIFTIRAFEMKCAARGSAFRNCYGSRRIYRSTLRDLQWLSAVRLVNDLSHTPYSPHYYRPRLAPFSRSRSYSAERGIREKENEFAKRKQSGFLALCSLPRSISAGMPPAIR